MAKTQFDKYMEGLVSNDYETDPLLPKSRNGVRYNEDGTYSTHLMAREYVPDRGWVVFPTLFQNDDDSWLEITTENGWYEPYQEAIKRDEVIDFGEDEEGAIDFADRGSWKKYLNSIEYGSNAYQKAYYNGTLGAYYPELDLYTTTPYAIPEVDVSAPVSDIGLLRADFAYSNPMPENTYFNVEGVLVPRDDANVNKGEIQDWLAEREDYVQSNLINIEEIRKNSKAIPDTYNYSQDLSVPSSYDEFNRNNVEQQKQEVRDYLNSPGFLRIAERNYPDPIAERNARLNRLNTVPYSIVDSIGRSPGYINGIYLYDDHKIILENLGYKGIPFEEFNHSTTYGRMSDRENVGIEKRMIGPSSTKTGTVNPTTGNPTNYDNDPVEVQNRILLLRKAATEAGVYDYNKEDFTKSHIKKLKQSIEENPQLYDYNQINSLFENVKSDRDLIWLMNNITYNDNSSNNQIVQS